MKKIFVLLVAMLFLNLPSVVTAHMAGQPPFFKVNGEFTDYYPVPTTSLNDFELPQDIAKGKHVVGETLEFEIDQNQLPILPDVVDQTKFLWKFGDGKEAQGLKNSHAYVKMGSFILTIHAQYQNDEPQLIQSTLINVLPDKEYRLPQAILSVNGMETTDPLIDPIEIDYESEVKFDSSKSVSGAKIVSFRWDFGDGKSSVEQYPVRTYDPDYSPLFPVLRIQDENGFISDAYVEIDHKSKAGSGILRFIPKTSGGVNYLFIPLIAVVLLTIGGFIFIVTRKDERKSAKD